MDIGYIVVTNCTARKRSTLSTARLTGVGQLQTVQALVAHWRALLAEHPPEVAASSLYVGRAMAEAKRTGVALDAPLWVVSAGLGWVPGDLRIPGYDLSAGVATDGLQALLRECDASLSEWWHALTGGEGLRQLLEAAPGCVLLMALPAEYLRMLSDEFAALQVELARRVRILTSEAGRRFFPADAAVTVLPYDERLESVPGFAGTRADFPQRALRHFVCELQAQALDAEAACLAVASALSGLPRRVSLVRRKAPDAEVQTLIRRAWRDCGGCTSRLLRHVRDEALVACEQRRFAQLCREVRQEFARLRAET